ncbi:hypothetical protein [uncultured Fluviicola sp.]|uniref:hypothetical protein n=1 Tax=uncultured Fluviicola sp. TaxID=463303 RepID=UPI0025EC3598|nr:hypothetical protein [uncultured Fluviicola sp.]
MNKKQKSRGTRSISWFLLLLFTWSTFQPTLTYAGGPTQPESAAFTPIGVSDMVDPFSGDFSYNIPLMDIEGYPINIAYNSGASMDQEASWVGLGWNLNAGAITRNLRGLPDDFNGDQVEKTLNTKPNFNINIDAGLTAEIAGFNLSNVGGGGGLSVGVGMGFNNYTGYSSSVSIGPSFDFGKFLGGNLTAGFSLSGSSENGASFAPNVSLSYKENKSLQQDIKRTGTIGTAFNSRAGLQQLTYGFSATKINYNAVKFTLMGHNFAFRLGEKSSSSASAGGAFNFGLASYMPTPLHSKFGASASFKMNVSGSLFAFDGQGNIGVSMSTSWIPDANKTMQVPSYGYMFSENGQRSISNQLDFNRDNDQPFSKYSVNLPSAFQTYDVFSVQAQGTGGSFRASRNDVGYVFDPLSSTTDVGADVGLELGFGNLTDIGVDIEIPITFNNNGPWTDNNAVTQGLAFKGSGLGKIVPSFGMIEASESSVLKDDLMTSQFNGTEPERFSLTGGAWFPRLNNTLIQSSGTKNITRNQKNVRDYSNNHMYFLSRAEVQAGMGVIPYDAAALYSGAKAHHIGEITQLGTDGRRYVFALPAYNHFQEDVTFATGNGLYSNDGINYSNDQSGLLNGVTATDASTSNSRGIDHYYSATKTPAYAHSYMLSAVLSDDYVDSDQTPGPSPDDLGSYVKFSYKSVKNFEWRNPIQADAAYYNEGMRSDQTDDKASFVYGKKDLHYTEKIETKNYVAIFSFEARKDGRSANGRSGGINPADAQSMVLLKSITLYSKPDYNANIADLTQATPIQQVVFDYNYSLCRHYPGNNENTSSDLTKGGKLTLIGIYFTYQNSKKMKYRNYKFSYGSAGTRSNPDYHIKGADRWGTYKEPVSASLSENLITTPLNNSDFPYAEQDPVKANESANAWNLVKIELPSGGEINVTYESDDYGYVQHKKAAQMFQIVGIYYADNSHTSVMTGTNAQFASLVSGSDKNGGLLFNLMNQTDDISKYGKKGQQLYFRVLSELDPNGSSFKSKTEFVSGYGIISEIKTVTISGTKYGLVKLESENIAAVGSDNYSPIIKQAILFGRSQLSRTINNNFTPSDESGGSEQAVMNFVNATINMITSFKELVTGPNKAVYDQGKGKNIVLNRSWIRLDCPSPRKFGGGSRVKEIRIKDNWDLMDGGAASEYGQTFKYVLEDGITSSGVASYEPQLGGDENPWHTAYIVNNVKRLAMDDKMYIDDPIMESQFPTPTVGYSRVVIEDLKYTNVKRTATGKVVKEFYTAKDFPTIVKRTNVDMLTDQSFLPLLPKYQYLTANQGFSIELNNMHGKPKKESIYGEGQTSPLSEVEYFYKSTPLNLDGVVNSRLSNTIQVINENGTVSNATVGVRYDAVGDFRESATKTVVPKIHINTNSFILAMLVIAIPPVYPGYDQTTNRFRSATMNKAVERFAILDKTVANQDGSIVETNNLAYDANTGEVLVTQTTTNFNDKIYSLNYPAYWNYPSFGQASKNSSYSYKASTVSTNGFAAIPAQYNYFAEGDEVSVTIGAVVKKGWVVDVNATGIRIIDKAGNPFTGSNATIKVLRSGYKNKQSTSMASMTSFSNPVTGIGTNQFTSVLNAGAIEFGQDWRTYCNCFGGANPSTNPYVIGTKGDWRPIRSYTYLTDRIQTAYDGNTNIRKDGVFRAYAPFYKLGNGKWEKNGQNWTFVSEVTEFSPNGMTLETRDALGRYSASQFGFNNTLTTAVAANSKTQQMSAGSFEDLGYTNCMDQNFFSQARINGGSLGPIPASSISKVHSHTGKTSIKVTTAAPVSFQNVVSTCEVLPDCNLSLTCGKDCTGITVEGGVAPYTMEYESTGGATVEQIGGNSFAASVLGSSYNSLTIIVTDSRGCKIGMKITVRGNVVSSETIQF